MKTEQKAGGRVFELVRGKRRPDMSAEQFADIVRRTSPYVNKLPGLLSRRVLIDGDTCVDIIEWESQAAVDAAMKQVMSSPDCAELMTLFEEKDMEMLHLRPLMER